MWVMTVVCFLYMYTHTVPMAYRIPNEPEVVKAIDNVMTRSPHIRSQQELYMLVSTELLCMNEEYRISGERIRRIGLKHNLFKVSIRYARTESKPRSDRCPVCHGSLYSICNRTLDGGTVELMRECRRCGYTLKGGSTRPAQYTVDRCQPMDRMRTARADKLRRAERLLAEAADLMDDALHMSGMESRSGKDAEAIRRIASDNRYSGSLRNLALDVEREGGDDPCWTRPLTSPKNQVRMLDDADMPVEGHSSEQD